MNRTHRPAEHPLDQLPEFISGRLASDEAAAVRSHLDRCSTCADELAAWRKVAGITQELFGAEALPAPVGLPAAVADAVRTAARRDGSLRRKPLGERLRWLIDFVGAQLPLVRRDIWPASAILMAIGGAVSILALRGGGVPGMALSLFAPLAAAVGVAQIYGQENDPAFEIALATPTSPRLVLLARLVLVLAWDLALAVVASVILALLDGPAVFLPLVSLWLGPMLLLGCLALLLSLFVHSSLAITAAAVLWLLRAIDVLDGPHLRELAGLSGLMDAVWQTSPFVVAAALLLLAASLAVAPSREPWASGASA